jgi:SAM-dependent methyltransferase
LTSRSDPFDANYYATGCGVPYERNEHWINFFGQIADRIVADIRPDIVLDVGCAKGFLVEGLRNRGVEAYGIDISQYAIDNVHPSIKAYCSVGSVTDPFPRRYNLIVCIEVLEHLPHQMAYQAVANLCQYTDDILFSSSPVDFKEVTHYNVQPPEYWAELFARHSFIHDVDYDASFIAPWTVRFRRSREPLQRVVMSYERRHWLLTKENQDLRSLADVMRNQLNQYTQVTAALNAKVQAQEMTIQQLSMTAAEQNWLLAEHKQLLAESRNAGERWQDLCRAYERGKFVRFMQQLHRMIQHFQ